jgi:hypothetical protein
VDLPWDVYATPIEATKLARLGVQSNSEGANRIVLLPAFFRQLGAPYAVSDTAVCPMHDHEAPQAGCTCGFYAVETDEELWRLGSYEPELAVLDVDLAGRVIAHEHGYRASHQHVRRVTLANTCVRCGKPAITLQRHWFGAITPACGRHAKQAVSAEEASAALGVPVEFSTEEPVPTPRLARLRFVLAQLVVPIAILLLGIGVAFVTHSGVPLNFAQLGVLTCLFASPIVFDRVAPKFGLGRRETVRLQRRWHWLVVSVVIACDVLITVVAAVAWNSMTA